MKWIKPRVSFLNEDMNLAKSIMKKKFDDYEKLKTLLAKNLGYMGKFTEYLINENIPFVELERLYKDLTTLKDKQSPVNINALSYEKVLDQVQEQKETLLINSLISQFPSEQKKFAREMLSEEGSYSYDNNKNILLKVAQKPDLSAFISKVSRYKTEEDLKKALKIFSKDPINDRETVTNLLKSLKSEIIFSNDDILIVKIDNYEDIKQLGSDTSWCIVGSKSTYDSYAKGRNQYIIYNYLLDEYDPKFKIGFTLTNDATVHAAHDILDGGASGELRSTLQKYNIELKSLIPKREPIIIDLKKLNSKTSGDKFKEIADQIELELIPDLVRIVIATNKNDDIKQLILRRCFKRILGNREWILESELAKIDKNFYRFVKYNTETIITNEVDGRLDEAAFLKGLEIWTPASFGEISMSFIKDIEEEYSKETLLKLSDKLNDLYVNNKIPWKDKGRKGSSEIDGKGVKVSKSYEGIMLVMNALCGRVEKTPNYAQIIKMPNYTIKYYNDIVKLPIDLEDNFDFEEDQLDLIIKKDYNTNGIYIKGVSKYTKLVEYLKDHKLLLKVHKEDLRKYLKDPAKYNANGINDRIFKMFAQFNLNKLITGKMVVDGNLTIKVV